MGDLLVATVEYRAALHAVTHWHYSKAMPPPRRVMLGVWESGSFRGVVIFSRGASPSLGEQFGLRQGQLCELTRIALRSHEHTVTQIVKVAIKQLRESAPGLRVIVSFADPAQGHVGAIYQAGNWIYLGQSNPQRVFVVHGRVRHGRSMGGRQFGSGRRTRQNLTYLREHIDPNAEQIMMPGKYRYAMPLDRAMRRLLEPRAQPYPRADEGSTGATALPGPRGGCDPRSRLDDAQTGP